ncbi:hypothetical protein E4P39_01355 [Blastococcus sp. CT_GayMR19]|uniref:hypothetical protein n=1 Tax=Blastococcus sp. CT_GayMR19 TaxID=2559608 RepID=UPI001073109B|nr:hypothetical protein [Blastococcus sp. CT_GayMR19]TFV79323.1 hypothetical protein E4P39_01355 [Blastococcus sp. CT_GayMR19]
MRSADRVSRVMRAPYRRRPEVLAMPRRAITVTHLFETVRYRPDNRVDLDKLPTGNLLYATRALFASLPRTGSSTVTASRYVSIEDMQVAGRTLLFDLMSGRPAPANSAPSGEDTYLRSLRRARRTASRVTCR